MPQYIAVLVPGDVGIWRALLPDVPECDAQASELTQARSRAAECLHRHVRSSSAPLPPPRSLQEIERDQDWLKRNRVDFSRALVTVVRAPPAPVPEHPGAHSGAGKRYYRCYFLKDDHIVGFEEFIGDSNVDAIEKARALLAHVENLTVELWRGSERIAAIDRSGAIPADLEISSQRSDDT